MEKRPTPRPAGEASPLLELEGVGRRFGPLVALADVSFALAAGEVVALLGENGAGKSTLVEIVGGGLRADRGRLSLDGAPYRPRDPRQAAARGVAVVHQHFRLVEAFTVAENLRLVVGGEGLAAAWERLAQRLGLPLPALERPLRGLGVGERQWLELGKALLRAPRLLLLDEPTAVLTPVERERLFAIVGRLAAAGSAVLFITHRLDEVGRLADRVLVLRRGELVAALGAGASSERLALAMTGNLAEPRPLPARRRGPVVARLRRVADPPRLEPLDLALHAGEVVVLAGVDGNGQVAAAERLAGLRRGPGIVEIRGTRVERQNVPALRAHGVALIPADRAREGVVGPLSVAENLVLGRHRRLADRGRGLGRARLEAEARPLLDRFAILGRPMQRADELSGGNQQRLVVARVLAGTPRVVVAIHPTRGLDVVACDAIEHRLVAAAADGAAVLVVTADLDEARRIGDRLLVFSRGRVVGEGDRTTPPELVARWVGGEAA